MPIIGPQCTRDGRTVCLRMSQTGLPVNNDAAGLTLVYGWPSEERRAQGVPASFQGIELVTTSGKFMLDHCPFCTGKIAGPSTAVRSSAGRRAAPEAARTEPAHSPVVAVARVAELVPAPKATAQLHDPAASSHLKLIREKLGLSQAELGEKLGLARSSVANYENGRSPLSQRLRSWIAKNESKLDGTPAARTRPAA